MLLQDKNIVVFGAGGSLGTAMALAFAAAGAKLYLSGLHLENVEQTAAAVTKAGGKAEAAQVDALDEKAVNSYVDAVYQQAGSIDAAINLIGWKDVQNIPLLEMSSADFEQPIHIATRTQFLTATAVGRKMVQQRSGVLLSLTATPGGIGYAHVGGFGPACNLVEAFSRNLAAELGVHGVRVVNIRSGGSPDSRVFREAIEQGGDRAAAFIEKMAADTMLKKMPPMKDIAQTAVFLASDGAASITGITIDVTAGTTAALNYKMTDVAFLTMR